ncbi:MAG TPA: hypothetical protein VJL58_08950 [Pyrinomonadaceae bacterium]|nr:hypothetical protein [Pyrinomonadaceae bacterium]
MRTDIPTITRHLIVAILATFTFSWTTTSAQEPPIDPNGKKIEGTWNMQVQWRNCDDGTTMLLPVPELRSFAGGGVTTVIDSTIWCEFGHCTSLGVWRYLSGRRYASTYKRSRVNPDTGEYTGSVTFVSSITHESDDSITTTDFLRFYDPEGSLTATRCRTATGTRFTGEN